MLRSKPLFSAGSKAPKAVLSTQPASTARPSSSRPSTQIGPSSKNQPEGPAAGAASVLWQQVQAQDSTCSVAQLSSAK